MKTKPVSVFVAMLFLVASALAKEKGLWKDSFVQVGDIKIHYLDTGEGDRTLVLIPGWTMAAEVWREQIPYFASRKFRVIAYDPRSQGLTTKTETGNTYQQHAADLHAFLKQLKIEHSYLVGFASGVTTLLEYVTSPETYKPEKLVFVNGSPAALRQDDYPGSMTTQQIRSLLLGLQDDRQKATEQMVRSLFKSRQPEALYKDLTDASMKTPMGAALSLLFDQFTGDRRPALLHVAVPTLIVTGPGNRSLGEYLQTKTPRSTLEVIEDAGDAVFLDKPQAFNQALETFLGEH
jgi:non-heme chloroperoxidase